MTTIEFNNHIMSMEDQLKMYAYKLTTNRDDAMDLCQETLLKAIKHRSNFTHNNLKAWIFTIMKNLFINAYRKKVKQREWISHETNRNLGSVNVSTENPHTTQNYKDIMHEVEKLDESLKIPFLMFLRGFKYREISDQIQLPIGTVKSRIFQSRKILSKRLVEFA